MNCFAEIPLGASESEVMICAGQPYQVHKGRCGYEEFEFEYIERMTTGTKMMEQRHYYILFRDGKVVGKRMCFEDTPPFWINSYDLQTGYNDTTQDDANDEDN